ncbi:MAG: hypothetical protein RLZ28_1440 [Actinomycetota bacterium]|jgi:predicted amidohydrolase YtcJ
MNQAHWLKRSDDGGWLAPAFEDRHCHPLFAARELDSLDLSGCTTVSEIVESLASFLRKNPDTQWIDASPFDRSISPSFLAATLDVVSRDIPITLHSKDHHALWVNSAALKVSGLSAEAPSLEDGIIVCDESGRPTGLLLEWSAMKVVLDVQSQIALERDLRHLETAQNRLLANGIFAASDAWIDPGMGEVYLEAARQDILKMPFELWVRASKDEAASQFDYLQLLLNDWLSDDSASLVKVAGIKIFLDGVLSARSAALIDNYRDGTSGRLIWSNDELNALLARLSRISTDLRPHFHAVGDAAVRQALEVIEAARTLKLWSGNRKPVIAHAELVEKTDAVRAAELGVEVVISPQWLRQDPERDRSRALLPEATSERIGDFTALVKAGVFTTYGSDWPVSEPSPLDAVVETVKHLRARGTPVDEAVELSWKISSGTNWPLNETENHNYRKVWMSENPIEVALENPELLSKIVLRLSD